MGRVRRTSKVRPNQVLHLQRVFTVPVGLPRAWETGLILDRVELREVPNTKISMLEDLLESKNDQSEPSKRAVVDYRQEKERGREVSLITNTARLVHSARSSPDRSRRRNSI